MKKNLALPILLALVFVVSASLGCSSSSGGGGSNFIPGFVDLAVGDLDQGNSCPANSKVLLYLDVLNTIAGGGTLAPDVTLDNATSLVAGPRSIAMTQDDLYIMNSSKSCGTDNIVIFRNFRGLSDGAVPDANLSTLASLNRTMQIRLSTEADTLVVADNGDDEVLLFRNASAIAADVAPDVTLDNATSLINSPTGIAILEDQASGGNVDLFVANNSNTSTGTASVTIYRDIASLVNSDAPDARLNADTSFFDFGCNIKKVDVFNDILYVTDEQDCGIFVFNGAGALATDALPDAVLTESSTDILSAPLNMDVVNNVLWVADRQFDGCGQIYRGAYAFGSANAMVSGQTPLFQLSFVQGAHQIQHAGGALFIDELDTCSFDFGSMHILFDATNVNGSSLPTASIIGGQGDPATELIMPISFAVVEQDQGT